VIEALRTTGRIVDIRVKEPGEQRIDKATAEPLLTYIVNYRREHLVELVSKSDAANWRQPPILSN
jgi:hypothetical protein